jgi:alkyl hydroperoxide reductase subunit AhpC
MAVRLGDPAPDFVAQTTEGEIEFHAWKGDRWAVLFSHPADFTPVCTTELGMVAARKSDFDARDTLVMGLSVDGVEDHRRWSTDIEQTQGTALNFPLAADPDGAIADAYDMIHPSSNPRLTIRSVFVISPDNTVALTLTYPPSVGRNFDEVLRVLDALQLTHNRGLATPANWQQGDRVFVSPSIDDATARATFGEFEAERPYLRLVAQPAA